MGDLFYTKPNCPGKKESGMLSGKKAKQRFSSINCLT